MRTLKWLVLSTGLIVVSASAATVTFEKIARTGDSVPGREVGVVFNGRAFQTNGPGVLSRPSINDLGEVVFRGVSSNPYTPNTTANGLYAKTPGQPLRVLVDTTTDANDFPNFPVPGRAAGTLFADFKTPLINNNGDVLFHATFSGSEGIGTGFFAITTDDVGDPIIVKIVDIFDEVPGHTDLSPPQTFNRAFAFDDDVLASFNDEGQIVFMGRFKVETETYEDRGIYGASVSGGSLVRLADTTDTVLAGDEGVPFQGLGWEQRILPAINNNGIVIFQGAIGNAPTYLDGLFTIPVDGSAASTTRALEGQVGPLLSDGVSRAYFSLFLGHDINDAGDFIFHHSFSSSDVPNALFRGTLVGGTQAVVVDNAGGFEVPGRSGADFTSIAIATINESGQMGFHSWDNTPNGVGIYAADVDGTSLALVANNSMTPPGRDPDPPGAVFTGFNYESATINDSGHMALAADGVAEDGTTALHGLYFYDACTSTLERLFDRDTVAAAPPDGLGDTFGSGAEVCIFDGFETRSGHYRSINNNNDVAVLVVFGTYNVGVYVAHVEAGSGETEITCPADVTIECSEATDPSNTGAATAIDGCSGESIPVTYADSVAAGSCPNESVITRTWTADDGSGVSCDQVITVVDTTTPVLTIDTTPIVVTDVDCSGDEAAALPVASATDNCDAEVVIADDAPATFVAGETTTVTFTATDACGNSVSEELDVTVQYGADIRVIARKFTIGFGTRPWVTREPLVGITVVAFEKFPGSCAWEQLQNNWWFLRWALPDIFDNCSPVATAVTNENGRAYLNVPPGDYVVASHFDADGDGELDMYLGRFTCGLECGEMETERLIMIRLGCGRRLCGKWHRLAGSELIIVEPEEVLWDGEEQQYPFVFDSEGAWDVTVGVTPPEGFVADHDELHENVDNELDAVQFTITEVGSELIPTQTRFEIMHHGQRHIIESEIGIRLTPDYAQSRGFNVAKLRARGLIQEVQKKQTPRQPRKP